MTGDYGKNSGLLGILGGSGILDDMGWYGGNSDGQTHLVGQKKANDWGYHDMHGNVWACCNDWFGGYDGVAIDPSGPASGVFRVLCGGGWHDNAWSCRSAIRIGDNPYSRALIYGFRLCCSAGPRE